MINTLSIVLPCYNPRENWSEIIVDNYLALVSSMPETLVEIIVVNDGSKTGISENDIQFLKKQISNFTYFSYNENKGKGFAVRYGFQKAKFENVIFTDVDFPYKIEGLAAMANLLFSQKADVTIGSRNPNYYKGVPFYRKLISKTLIAFNKIMLKLPSGETQAGLKGFSAKGKKMLLQSTINGYLFDIEVLKLAVKNNCIIQTTPIELKDDVVFSKMSFSLLLKELKNYMKILIG